LVTESWRTPPWLHFQDIRWITRTFPLSSWNPQMAKYPPFPICAIRTLYSGVFDKVRKLGKNGGGEITKWRSVILGSLASVCDKSE
jgi:hypothetical protein